MCPEPSCWFLPLDARLHMYCFLCSLPISGRNESFSVTQQRTQHCLDSFLSQSVSPLAASPLGRLWDLSRSTSPPPWLPSCHLLISHLAAALTGSLGFHVLPPSASSSIASVSPVSRILRGVPSHF